MSVKIKQKDITDCGAACLASIAANYKLYLPIAKIRQISGTDKKGTNVLGLITAANKMGFTAKGVKGKSDALSQIPLPAIAHVIINKTLAHYVVIYSATKSKIRYMDPANGQFNSVSMPEFTKIWTGVLVLLQPSNNFIPGNQKTSNISRFYKLINPHRSILFQSLFGAIVYTILGLSTAIYIQKITDNILVNGNTNLLNLLSLIMLAIIGLQIFISANKSIFMLRTGQKIDAQLILGYYKHLLILPQQFFDTMRVGEIVSRINDAVKIRAFINDTAVNLIVNVFIVIFSFGLMYFYSWKLAVLMTLIIPLYTLTYFLIRKLNKKVERRLMENAAELESQLIESLNSIRTIKQFGLESFSNAKTESKFIQLLRTVYKSGLNSIFSSNTTESLSRIFTIILLWAGSYAVIRQELTPGQLLSFYAIIGYFTSPAANLINMNKIIQNALIAADRLFEILDLETEDEDHKYELESSMIGDIRFENISFTYGTRTEVFKDLSIQFKKGEMTAIIGESGSGKTTIASLLLNLYPLNSGQIFIGKINLNYLTNSSIRNKVGVIPQQIHLFNGNVIENIALGDLNPNMENVIQICTSLGIIKFIEQLPSGFKTYIGENGASLSGGEKQRIAIARALYRKPEILILDEATSSLDSTSENYVQQTLKGIIKEGKTIIIIAHRLSTVINANKIAVLEKGRLIEEGSHEDLYKIKGSYYQQWQKQIPQFIKSNT